MKESGTRKLRYFLFFIFVLYIRSARLTVYEGEMLLGQIEFLNNFTILSTIELSREYFMNRNRARIARTLGLLAEQVKCCISCLKPRIRSKVPFPKF